MQISIIDQQTIWDDQSLNLAGLSGLGVVTIGPKTFLVASGAAENGLSIFEILPDGSLNFTDTISGAGLSGADGVQIIEAGGNVYLIPEGQFDADLGCYQLDATGQLSFVDSIPGGGGTGVSDSIEIGGQSFLFSAEWNQSGFESQSIASDGAITQLASYGDSAGQFLGDVSAIEAVNLRGKDYLFVASGVDAGIESYRINADGSLISVDQVVPSEGGFSGISDMAGIDACGRSFLVVADAGTDSLLVYRVSKGGNLKLKEVLTDTNDLRIANVQDVEVFEWQGRSFVVAGGGDDGFSVFEINKKGESTHLGTVADDFHTSLDNISSIAVQVLPGEVQLFIGSDSEHGITRFSLTLDNGSNVIEGGKTNDILTGTAGDDTIYGYGHRDTLHGEGGDDRLHDGRGRDEMWGGSGADVFVFTKDRSLDKIMDYELGTDLIDLSDYPLLYHISDLVITPTADGAIIDVNGDLIEIHSTDGQPLQATDFLQDYFLFG